MDNINELDETIEIIEHKPAEATNKELDCDFVVAIESSLNYDDRRCHDIVQRTYEFPDHRGTYSVRYTLSWIGQFYRVEILLNDGNSFDFTDLLDANTGLNTENFNHVKEVFRRVRATLADSFKEFRDFTKVNDNGDCACCGTNLD